MVMGGDHQGGWPNGIKLLFHPIVHEFNIRGRQFMTNE